MKTVYLLLFLIVAILIYLQLTNENGLTGMILSIKNNNPGNLIYVSTNQWNGQIGKDPLSKFAQFDTALNGTRANCINAINIFQKYAQTLLAFGDIWAPVSDNAGSQIGSYGKGLVNYINSNFAGVPTEGAYDFKNYLSQLIEAIAHNEGGIPNVIYFRNSFTPGALLALQARGLV